MLNEVYEKLEAVLNGLDTGGEQSRAFEGEIVLIKELLGYPEPVQDDWNEAQRLEIVAHKLRRLAVESEGILIPLPQNPIVQWFDGTYQDAAIDMQFTEVDLAKLLKFMVEVGVANDAEGGSKQKRSAQKRLEPAAAAELLEACKTLLSYTSELLYRLDNQVDLNAIQELRQAKAAIARYEPKDDPAGSQQFEITLKELSPDHPCCELKAHLLCEYGKFWIRPEGFGDAYSLEGDGWPIGLELWQGRLRLLVFSDINNEEPQILDLEKARESCRIDDTQDSYPSTE